jgi:putative phage-type endonuclease
MAGRGAVTAFGDHCEWTGASADNRENWLISRRAGVGGSDAAAIMGVNEYASELAVYVEKISDAPPDDSSSEMADWGRIFEPAILKEYARRSKRRVVRGGKLMRSKRAAHHLVTLDGVQLTRPPPGVRGAGVAEVKTTGYGNRYDADLPVEVQVQIQWELWVTGAEWATCIWLPFPERRLQWLDVMPHRAFQEVLAERVDNFWQRVQRREPPDPDGSESSALALRRLYPGETDETIRIPGKTVCALADEYERNKAAMEMLKLRQGLIRNTLAATIRESKYALLDDGRYWGTAFYKPRTNDCRHCGQVLSTVDAYRTYTLRDPRKKPFLNIAGTRELVAALDDEQLTKQLSESMVGTAPAENETSSEIGAAE